MLTTIIVFVAILALLVLAHELGHFVSAKILGVKVEEFGFGFPPRLLSTLRKSGTRYSLNWLPLGGFVKLKGESGENRDPDSFAAKKPWQRSIILLAGVVMNVVLCFILLSIGFVSGLPTIVDETNIKDARDVKIQIFSVLPNSPAHEAGIKPGDVVVTINDYDFMSLQVMQDFIAGHKDIPMEVKLSRGNETVKVTVTPKILEQSGNSAVMGVSLVETGIISYPWYQSLWMGVKSTGILLYEIVNGFVMIIRNLIVTHQAGVEVVGPVGIAVLTGQVVDLGWIYVLQFAALLSVNLAIINILPFPALDGGRLLFVIIEKIRRKPNNEKIEAMVHQIGFVFLILLIVLITYQDLLKFGNSILGAVSKLWRF